MKNVPDEICRGTQNTQFDVLLHLAENRAVYEIMWKNITEPDRPQMTKWRMHITCWIPKARNTHSEYIKLIALARQQWLRERISMLSLYIRCVSCYRDGVFTVR